MKRFAMAALIAATMACGAAAAVTILDSTFDAHGYELAEKLAAEPQFAAAFALCQNDYCGGGSATWIGNDAAHGYLITAAHTFVGQGFGAKDFTYRASDGKEYAGEALAVHPFYKQAGEDNFTRSGWDFAIVTLSEPVAGIGDAPTLYAGDSYEELTYVGFGARGKASTGEDETIAHGDQAAAADGMVTRHSAEHDPIAEADADLANVAQVPLLKEDGSVPCPEGHTCEAAKPATPTAGAIGAGDSGGGAWQKVPVEEGKPEQWQLAGVNVVGLDSGKYGGLSMFAMVVGVRDWVKTQFPAVKIYDPYEDK